MRKGELELNLLFFAGPITFGLLFILLSRPAMPALTMLTVGFLIFAKAKWSLIRQGKLATFGPSQMTPENRRAYFLGYIFMGIGLVFALSDLGLIRMAVDQFKAT